MALEQTIVEILPRIYASARYLTRDSHIAEEAVQETMMRLIESWRLNPGRIRAPLAWCHRILGDSIRKRCAGGSAIPLDASFLVSSSSTPDENAVSNETRERLRIALSRMHADEREAVVLHIVGGLPIREMANTLSLPRSTAHERLRRGLASLRRCLGPSAAAAAASGRASTEEASAYWMRRIPADPVPEALRRSIFSAATRGDDSPLSGASSAAAAPHSLPKGGFSMAVSLAFGAGLVLTASLLLPSASLHPSPSPTNPQDPGSRMIGGAPAVPKEPQPADESEKGQTKRGKPPTITIPDRGLEIEQALLKDSGEEVVFKIPGMNLEILCKLPGGKYRYRHGDFLTTCGLRFFKGGSLIYVMYDNSVHAISPEGGKTVWSYNAKKVGLGPDFVFCHINQMILQGKNLIIDSNANGVPLTCLDADTGTVRWQYPEDDSEHLSWRGMWLIDGALIANSARYTAKKGWEYDLGLALDPGTGRRRDLPARWRIPSKEIGKETGELREIPLQFERKPAKEPSRRTQPVPQ